MIWFIFYLAISQKFRESAWKHWLFYFLFHIVKKYYKTLSRSKFFREINTLITSFVKTLIWRKKCWFFRNIRKIMEFLYFFLYSSAKISWKNKNELISYVLLPYVYCTVHSAQCGNYTNLLSHFFGKNFVKPIILLKRVDLTKYFLVRARVFFILPHCTLHSVVKSKIYSHQKNISSNHLFSDFFSKIVAFTNFLPKMSESKF